MDNVRYDADQRIQQSQREAHDEIKQLRAAIQDLRDRLESAQRSGIAARAGKSDPSRAPKLEHAPGT
jgi:uncharacterized protein YlxW (UPF0749 family)